MQPPYPTFKAALERIAELEAKLKAQVDSDEIDWVQCRARIAELEASLNFLGRRYAGVESTSHGFQLERDRYREALDLITCQPRSCGADMLEIATKALRS